MLLPKSVDRMRSAKQAVLCDKLSVQATMVNILFGRDTKLLINNVDESKAVQSYEYAEQKKYVA
jgi:hypothetical protein